jgi:hypothetical protein
MYKTTATRRDLLDIIQDTSPAQLELRGSDDTPSRLKNDPLYTLLWDRNEPDGELPSVMLMPASDQEDFLAWAYTYLSGIRPFTAFVRLLDPQFFENFYGATRRRALGRLREAFVSLIIGEAFSHLEPKNDYRQLTANACANTHTFALARAFILGFDGEDDKVSNSWYTVRELTKQSIGGVGASELKTPWDVLSRLAGGHSSELVQRGPVIAVIESACREILELGEIRPDTWFHLTSAFPGVEEARDKMAMSRESRIKAFENMLPVLARAHGDDNLLASFIAGYIGSKIAPGELDHFVLFIRPASFAPAALLWFSLCAGLQGQGQVLSFLDGLGRRILRDLDQQDNLIGRPRSDLAFMELKVLFGREKVLSEFRTTNSNALNVELLPGVTTTVRWPRSQELKSDLFEKRESFAETRQLLSELSFSLDRVEGVRRRLERALDPSSSASRYVPEKRPRKH